MKRYFLILLSIFNISCSPPPGLSGYIEGEYTYIASTLGGTLFNLNVARGQEVKRGDLLYSLDPQPEQDEVNSMQMNIAQLQAELNYAKTHFEREQAIYKVRGASQDILEQAKSNFESKQKQLAASQSQLNQMQWSLQQKTRYSPANGRVFDIFYRLGETIPMNRPVLALLTPDHIKVLFYVPEKILSQIQLGQTISFTCDTCPTKTQATISYVSPEAQYTPPIIYSRDTRDKLVYLVRADMPEETAKRFHPGQPITIALNP